MSATGEPPFAGTEQFRVQGRLGAGGMGVVYRALDQVTGQSVALKLLRGSADRSVERFQKELSSIRDAHHPNLVKLDELHHEGGRWFYTMELVPGVDFLAHVRPTPKAFDEGRLRGGLRQLAAGVAALHGLGMVHRDIKPSNVLVTPEGRVVLLDFGLVAEVVAGRQLEDIEAVGTSAYMAPEQASGEPVGPAADWYSVGVVLYEALVGERPHRGTPAQLRVAKHTARPLRPSERCEGVPEDLDELCEELLRYPPEERPTGRAVLERLGMPLPEGSLAATPADGASAEEPPPLEGRDVELERARAAFDAARQGAGTTLLVTGEAGIGKRALVDELLRRIAADHPELVVLRGRCTPTTRSPFDAVDGVVHGLAESLGGRGGPPSSRAAPWLPPENASAVTRAFPVMRGVGSMASEADPDPATRDPHELRARAFFGVRSLLERLAKSEPMVVFLDEAQWLDRDSLELLAEVTRAPFPPLLLVLAATSIEGSVRQRLLGSSDAAELSLGALDEEQGRPPLRERVVERVAGLDDPHRHVLDLVALAGGPLDEVVLADAAGLDAQQCARIVADLQVAHLLLRARGALGEEVGALHDLVRQVVVEDLGEARRVELHWELSSSMEATQEPAYRWTTVRHLEGAGKKQRAAELAERAASEAMQGLAYSGAAGLLEVALRLGEHSRAARSRLCSRRAGALRNAGRLAEAARADLDALLGASPAAALELRRRAATALLQSGHLEEALEQLGSMLATVGESLPSSPRRALASLLWHRARLRRLESRWTERPEHEIAPIDLVRQRVYLTVGGGLALIDNIRGADFQARSLSLALNLGARRQVAHALANEAAFVGSQGKGGLSRARRLLGQARGLALAEHDPHLVGWVTAVDGILCFWRGDIPMAVRLLEEGEAALRNRGTDAPWQLNNARIFLLLADRYGGQLLRLRERSAELVHDAIRRGDRYMEATVRRVRALAWLAEGKTDEAREDLAVVAWEPPEGAYHIQHWYVHMARVELALYTGRARSELAELERGFVELSRSLLTRVQAVEARSAWLQARLLLAAAEESRAPGPMLDRAARIARRLRREGHPPARAWAELVGAGVAAGRGRRSAAARRLRAAVSVAEERHAPHVAAAARCRLGELVSGPAGETFAAAGQRWMESMAIAEPARFLEVLAPGLSSR